MTPQNFKPGMKVAHLAHSIAHSIWFVSPGRERGKEPLVTDQVSGVILSEDPYGNPNVVLLLLDEDEKVGYPLATFADKKIPGLSLEQRQIFESSNRKFCRVLTQNLTLQNNSHSQTKETKMANKVVETLKGDAKEAAYRVASTQITNGVKLGLVKLFEKKGGGSEQMEMLKGLLDSEMGESLIALMLGYGLSYAPGLKEDPRVQKISEEFRVQGMTVAGNAVVGAAMESILPVLTTALNALPPVEEVSKPRLVESSEEQEDEHTAPPARKSKTAGR